MIAYTRLAGLPVLEYCVARQEFMARICIDGLNLALPAGSGIATYARNLNVALADLGHETQLLFGTLRQPGADNLLNQIALLDGHSPAMAGRLTTLRRLVPRRRPRAREIVVSGDVLAKDRIAGVPPATRLWACRDIFYSANSAYRLFRRFTPLQLGDQIKTDIAHWTAPLPLFEPRIPNVYTLHDLIPLRLPFTTIENKRAYLDMCKTIAARADRIFTVSENTRQDVIRMLGADDNRVVNTYQAVELPAQALERTESEIGLRVEGLFGLEPRGYFLYFGTIEPKKNLARMVEAYLSSGAASPLVIVGKAWLNPKQRSRKRNAALETGALPYVACSSLDRIRRYEYLPFSSLLTLIQGAKAVLFPSIYEGFGLPVLEAMQLGTPVLTSTAGSLPEVAGDAAILVDPFDVDAIRGGIRTLEADASLRAELADRGRRQALMFSPERYRERLQAAYAPLL
jgi:glycosyltransferase involved in cell wall biosynthesis